MAKEIPTQFVDIEDVLPLSEQVDKIAEYRKLFPENESDSALVRAIQESVSSLQITSLTNDLIFYARNYTAYRLGLPLSSSSSDGIDGTYSGAMTQITEKLSGVMEKEMVLDLTKAIRQAVDETPVMRNLQSKFLY